MSNKAKFDIIGGVCKAFARNKNPHTDTLLQISYYNVLGEYVNNINKLENIAKKTGQGIIHFNNPQQLVDRLELLAGSIFAGNNGKSKSSHKSLIFFINSKSSSKKNIK